MLDRFLRFGACVGCGVLAASLSAAEWHVDCENGSPSGNGSPENPYSIIQDAVEAAAEGDTILVHPGIYGANQESRVGQKGTGYTQLCRVNIKKRLKLVSTGGREVTHIVGDNANALDDENGSNSVACVWIQNVATNSVIEGFTLRDGGACWKSTGGAAVGIGGMSSDDSPQAYSTNAYTIAYCTVSNCIHKYGAVYNGVMIGSRITDCRGSSCAAARRISAVNCIFDRNSGTNNVSIDIVTYPGKLVNCSFLNNNGYPTTTKAGAQTNGCGLAWNLFFMGSRYANDHAKALVVTNGVFVASSSATKTDLVAESSDRILIPSVNYPTNLVVNSVLGDARPLAGGILDEAGDREAFDAADFIPPEYRQRDYFGNIVDSGAEIPVGVILPAVDPETLPSPGVSFVHPFNMKGYGLPANGVEMYGSGNFFIPPAWPYQISLGKPVVASAEFLGVGIDSADKANYTTFNSTKYKGMKDRVWLMLPPLRNAADELVGPIRCQRRDSSGTIYVNGSSTDAATPDGSLDHPYRTIQDAIDDTRVGEQKKYYKISVAPGDYASGATTDPDGAQARVVVPASTYALIVAEGGPTVTSIAGAPDPDRLESAVAPGHGPKAVRCVYSANSATLGIAGFTISNGYCWAASDGKNATASAVRAGGTNQHIYDCVITANHQAEDGSGSPVNNCAAFRCVFSNNVGCARGAVVNSRVTGSLFADNARPGDSSAAYHNTCWIYGCTVHEPDAGSASFGTTQCTLFNNVYAAGKAVSTAAEGYLHAFNVVSDAMALNMPEESNAHENPRLAMPGLGDFRPLADSPVLGKWTLTTAVLPLTDFVTYVGDDLDGNPVVTPDGKLTPGAFVTPAPDYPADPVVYVSPTGNDANDGLTEETPKASLQLAVNAVRGSAARTVVALPGTYETGSAMYTGYVISSKYPTPHVKSRVVVPPYVTLKSRDGAATTVIEGAPDPNDDTNAGLGPNAVRGVFLEDYAILDGFTVTNGFTDAQANMGDGAGVYDDIMGGGVYARGTSRGACVRNCLVTGNTANYGGGLCYVSAERCRIIGNVAYADSANKTGGSAGRTVSLYNCFVDDNRGTYIVHYPGKIVGCTFGPGNLSAAGKAQYPFVNADASTEIVDNLLLCAWPSNFYDLSKAGRVSNYVGPIGTKIICTNEFGESRLSAIYTNEFTAAELQAFYNADGSPKAVTAPSVDRGAAVDGLGLTDLTGFQRIMNRTVDIGCHEADWSETYAQALNRRATVESATPMVWKSDTGVELMKDDRVVVTIDASTCPHAPLVGDVVIENGGTLSVYKKDAETPCAVLTETGTFETPLSDTADTFEFVYDGTGSATITKLVCKAGLLLLVK